MTQKYRLDKGGYIIRDKKIAFKFIQSHENLIFQYTKTSKDDYILLCSFLKNISFI